MSETDEDVRAWTETFVNYFLPTHMNREGWLPLIRYYEGASAGAHDGVQRDRGVRQQAANDSRRGRRAQRW